MRCNWFKPDLSSTDVQVISRLQPTHHNLNFFVWGQKLWNLLYLKVQIIINVVSLVPHSEPISIDNKQSVFFKKIPIFRIEN